MSNDPSPIEGLGGTVIVFGEIGRGCLNLFCWTIIVLACASALVGLWGIFRGAEGG